MCVGDRYFVSVLCNNLFIITSLPFCAPHIDLVLIKLFPHLIVTSLDTHDGYKSLLESCCYFWRSIFSVRREELNIVKADLKSKTEEVTAKTADIEEKTKISNQVRKMMTYS